jgi:hypothetical protein
MSYYGKPIFGGQDAMGGVAHNPEGMRNALAPAVERDSIQGRLNALEAQLDVLGGAINELESSIVPILSEPSPQKEPCEIGQGADSALMQRIGLLQSRAHTLTLVVQSISRRVTL